MARVVLTGCTRGLGRATAERLLADGHTVTGLVRRPAAVPVGVHALACDLEDRQGITQAARAISGPVDVLVHNAGLFLGEVAWTPEGLERMWAVHVVAPLRLTEALAPTLAPGGRVVFIASTAYRRGRLGATPVGGQAGYRRAKLGQVLLAHALAPGLAARGVSVHALHPGVVRTDIGSRHTTGWLRLGWRVLRTAGVSPDHAAAFVASVAVGERPPSIGEAFLTPSGPRPPGLPEVPGFLEGLRATPRGLTAAGAGPRRREPGRSRG